MIDTTKESHATDRPAAACEMATAVAPPVSIAFHAVDEADRQHLSSHFWHWSELFDHDPNSRVAQHPEHLFSQLSEDVVLCEASRGDQVVALGILSLKTMTLRQAGGFVPHLGLRGYRLVGNRLLGQADESLTRQMLAACASFTSTCSSLTCSWGS